MALQIARGSNWFFPQPDEIMLGKKKPRLKKTDTIGKRITLKPLKLTFLNNKIVERDRFERNCGKK